MPTVRPATKTDLAAVVEIYNHYVRETHVTFDLEPHTVDGRREWFARYGPAGRHRMLVACDGDEVLGYATSSPWRPRKAYEPSIETSVYIDHAHIGKGLGVVLYEALFEALRGEDVHRAYAGIALPNDSSIALHERFGFRRAGLFTEQGRKFGRWWDVAWYEKRFE